MDIFDLFFGAGPATKKIFKLGFMPKDEDFLELTEEQYRKYFEKEKNTNEKVYALLPKDPKHSLNEAYNELSVCTESDIDTLKRGWEIIESYCKNATYPLLTDEDKLYYAAARLPRVFSQGTKFAHAPNFKVSSNSSNPTTEDEDKKE